MERENRQFYRDGVHPTATPLLYATHGCLQLREPEIDYWMFQIAGTVALAAGCILIGGACGMRLVASLLIAAAMLLAHRAVQLDIAVANVNRLQVGVFAIAFGWMARASAGRTAWQTGADIQSASTQPPHPGPLPRIGGEGTTSAGPLELAMAWILAGGVLGWLILYKPNMLLAGALPGTALLIDARWRAALGMFVGGVAGAAGGFAVGMIYFGRGTWLAWFEYVSGVWSQPFALEAGNYALPRLLADSSLRGGSLAITGILIALIIIRIAATRSRAARESNSNGVPGRYAFLAAIGLCVPLVSAPVTWGHYIVLSIPLAVVMTCIAVRRGEARSTADYVALAGIGLTMLVPATWIPGTAPVVVLLTIQTGLLLLLAAALWRLPPPSS
jgi:hypothetical protein